MGKGEQGGTVQCLGVGGSPIHAEKNFEAAHKSRTRRALTAEMRHHTAHDHLLHPPAAQLLFKGRTIKGIVLRLADTDPTRGVQGRYNGTQR